LTDEKRGHIMRFVKSDEEKSRFFGLLQRAPAAEKGCRKES
jgi:hypothetical protein